MKTTMTETTTATTTPKTTSATTAPTIKTIMISLIFTFTTVNAYRFHMNRKHKPSRKTIISFHILWLL